MITFDKCSKFEGKVSVPSDKSITHRAIIMGAMADDVSVVDNYLISRDTEATINAMRAVGVDILAEHGKLLIRSDGYRFFNEPTDVVDCSNSGTTARLLAGVFAPRNKFYILSGDASLKRRPMDRVIKPLSKLGANIKARNSDKHMPLVILPSVMNAGEIAAETKSAQVKSAVLLAAAQIEGQTIYHEPVRTRDHSERMMKDFGVDISVSGDEIIVNGGLNMNGVKMKVPGDFSSASFFIAAALAFEGSDVVIENVGLNPTRTGFLEALEDLGADIQIEEKCDCIEPSGTLRVKSKRLRGGTIHGDIIANLIDEAPLLAFLGLFAENPIEVRDASELRVKESDRIGSIITNFKSLGAQIEEFPDGFKVYPLKNEPKKAMLKSFDDHRICMINIMLAKKFGMNVLLDDVSAVDVSFPDFISVLSSIEVN